jgi:hypothetical protein
LHTAVDKEGFPFLVPRFPDSEIFCTTIVVEVIRPEAGLDWVGVVLIQSKRAPLTHSADHGRT